VDIERNRAHISRGGARLFSFLLLARGSGEFEHCGHSTTLQAGDFTLCDNAAPHRLHSGDATELVVLRVSPEVIREHLPNPEITQIAFGTGFNSAAHFTRAFSRQYHETPSQFRRRGALDG